MHGEGAVTGPSITFHLWKCGTPLVALSRMSAGGREGRHQRCASRRLRMRGEGIRNTRAQQKPLGRFSTTSRKLLSYDNHSNNSRSIRWKKRSQVAQGRTALRGLKRRVNVSIFDLVSFELLRCSWESQFLATSQTPICWAISLTAMGRKIPARIP